MQSLLKEIEFEDSDILKDYNLPDTFINYKFDAPIKQWRQIIKILKERDYIIVKIKNCKSE